MKFNKFIFSLVILGSIASGMQPMEQKKSQLSGKASLRLITAHQIAKSKSLLAIEKLKLPVEMKELVSCVKQHQQALEKSDYIGILHKIACEPSASSCFLEELEKLLDSEFYEAEDRKNQLLRIAADHGNTNLVDWLIKQGTEVDAISAQANQYTALLYATQNNHIPVVQLLIDRGADVNKESAWGHSPLGNAILYCDDMQLFDLLVAHGAKIKASDLCKAAQRRWNAMIERLLSLGASIEGRENIYSYTALQQACSEGHIRTIDLLLCRGADINAVDNTGRSAFMIAANIQDPQIRENTFEQLLEHGAQNQINTPDQNGKTPLMHSVKELDLQLVTYLLDRNTLCNIQDGLGNTVLSHYLYGLTNVDWDSAKGEKAKKILELLLAHNAPINVANAQGETPLIQAAKSIYSFRSGMVYFMKALLDAGADINGRDNQGKTALDYALDSKEDRVINFLLHYKPQMSLRTQVGLFDYNYRTYITIGALVSIPLIAWYFSRR